MKNKLPLIMAIVFAVLGISLVACYLTLLVKCRDVQLEEVAAQINEYGYYNSAVWISVERHIRYDSLERSFTLCLLGGIFSIFSSLILWLWNYVGKEEEQSK